MSDIKLLKTIQEGRLVELEYLLLDLSEYRQMWRAPAPNFKICEYAPYSRSSIFLDIRADFSLLSSSPQAAPRRTFAQNFKPGFCDAATGNMP
jgi:hypothetical protein